jgi:hypothetical protein
VEKTAKKESSVKNEDQSMNSESSNEDDGVAINENMLREGDCHSSF